MAIKKEDAYNRLENIVVEKVLALEAENAQLRTELATANAKLSIYERIASVSDSKITLGFGPPIERSM